MLRLVRRMTSRPGVAEEILQEAWLAVWRSAAGFRGESSARGWLFGVARRQAHNQLRRPEPAQVELDAASSVADPTADVEDLVLAGAARDELAAGVRALPDHLREVLVLVLVEDMGYPDVAATLGIPVGTVKSRMSHARSRLASALHSTAANPAEPTRRPA
jgi:RNA polymerase sigma-70 factor (ECF subfamily)